MNKHFYVLLLLLPCFFFTTACSDTNKEKATCLIGRIIAPEGYKYYESTRALEDYINAYTKSENNLCFLHSKNSLLEWMEGMFANDDVQEDDFNSLGAQPYDFDSLLELFIRECPHPLWNIKDAFSILSNEPEIEDNPWWLPVLFMRAFNEENINSYALVLKEGSVYSGVYLCASMKKPIVYAYPFSAHVKNGEVTQFHSETNDRNIKAINLFNGQIGSKAQYQFMEDLEEKLENLTVLDLLNIIFD